MVTIIMEQTDWYTLHSIGNGAAYQMYDKRTGDTRFVQYGDDATAFREEYEAMQAAYGDPASVWHKRTWNVCLRELWELMA